MFSSRYERYLQFHTTVLTKCVCIVSFHRRWKRNEQYPGFARALAPYYWLDSTQLNFRDRTRPGAVYVIWPFMSIHKYCHNTYTIAHALYVINLFIYSLSLLQSVNFCDPNDVQQQIREVFAILHHSYNIMCMYCIFPTHRTTGWTRRSLTSGIGRDRVQFTWYDRS